MLGRGLRFRVVADRRTGSSRELDVEIAPAVAPDLEQQARDRQADIDDARKYHAIAAEVDELVENQASERAFLHRLDALGRRQGTTGLIAPIRAALVGDELTGHVARDSQSRSGWKRGDKLIHQNRGEVTYLEPDSADSLGAAAGPGGAQWVEFDDGNAGMVSAYQLSGYVPPQPGDRDRVRQLARGLAEGRGIRLLHRSGEVVRYDRRRHEAIHDIEDDQQVYIIRPGFEYTPPGDEKPIRVRAVVMAA